MKKNIKLLAVIALCIGLLAINTKVYAETAKVNTGDVRLRKQATTNSDVVEVLPKNTEVEIISKDGDWYKVQYKNGNNKLTGYIRQDLLDVNEETSSETSVETNIIQDEPTANEPVTREDTVSIQENVTITINSKTDLRILPLINSSKIGSLDEKTEVFINEIIGKWCYVETSSLSGWVLTSRLEASDSDVKEDENKGTDEETKEDENETSVEDNKTDENKASNEDTKSDENTTSNGNTKTDENKTSGDDTKKDENKTSTETKTMYVSASALNVRKEANTTSEVIDQLLLNEKVTVIEKVDSTWSKIQVSGKTGYVVTEYLSDTKTEITSRSSDETRTSTSEEDEKNQTTENEQKEETASEDNKTEETTSESSESSKKEETTSNNDEKTDTGVTGEDVVAYAKTFLGCKYVYGASGPSTFDCSGFTQYVYKHFGYSLYRTSGEQRKNGIAVSKSELKAGDILCFEGHVGIYVGKNSDGERTFIHAESPSTGVRISSLDQKYYTNSYICARRIIY